MPSSWNVFDASHMLQAGLSSQQSRASRTPSAISDGPLVPSRAINRPPRWEAGSGVLSCARCFFLAFFVCAFDIRGSHPAAQPCEHGVGVPLGPASALAGHEHLADRAMLFVDRLPRVHFEELKNLGQRLILLNHAAHKLKMALVGVGNVGHVLAGSVETGQDVTNIADANK